MKITEENGVYVNAESPSNIKENEESPGKEKKRTFQETKSPEALNIEDSEPPKKKDNVMLNVNRPTSELGFSADDPIILD